MAANPYAQYQKTQIETADQGKLLIMLYEGALRYLGQSRTSLEEEKLEEANNNLVRVQEIIAELMSSLDLEVGAVAVSLFRIYEYMHYLLVEANINKSTEPLDQVEKMLLELRNAWKEALYPPGNTADNEVAAQEKEGTAGKTEEVKEKDGLRAGYGSYVQEQAAYRRVNTSG